MVCVGDGPGGTALVRYAQRLAERLGVGWSALHVEVPRPAARDAALDDDVAESLRLADRLGGDAAMLRGDDIAGEALALARDTGVAWIVIGAPRRMRWIMHRRGSIIRNLLHDAGDIGVLVMPRERRAPRPDRIARRAKLSSYLPAASFVAIDRLASLSFYPIVARARAKAAADLHAFGRQLTSITELDDLLSFIVAQLSSMLKSPVAIFLVDGETVALRAVAPRGTHVGVADLAAAVSLATGATSRGAPSGSAAEAPLDGRHLVALRTARGILGAVGIVGGATDRSPTSDDRRWLEALADQTSIAIERIIFAAEIDRTRRIRSTEGLQSALLASISHDLRTPLSSVLVALSSLRNFDDRYDPQTRRDLLDTAQEEAERLNRFVGNLLDMTKLEAGAIAVRREPVLLADVIGSAVREARKILGQRPVAIDMPPDLPMLALDFVLFEQALFNLLDNAAKYTPPSSTITVAVRHAADRVTIEIADEGPGIPPADLERIFDKFYRVRSSDHQRAGTGLGLVVSRGFIEAQGGRIVAGNRNDCSGAVFTITLPSTPFP